MFIRKDDTVIVLTGKDRGKTGKVLRALPETNQVVIEGINLRKKHQRPTRANQKGQIVDRPAPLNISNVSLVDPKTGKPSRVRFEKKDGKKVRVSVKGGVAF